MSREIFFWIHRTGLIEDSKLILETRERRTVYLKSGQQVEVFPSPTGRRSTSACVAGIIYFVQDKIHNLTMNNGVFNEALTQLPELLFNHYLRENGGAKPYAVYVHTKKLENKPNCIWLCDDSASNQSVQVLSRAI